MAHRACFGACRQPSTPCLRRSTETSSRALRVLRALVQLQLFPGGAAQRHPLGFCTRLTHQPAESLGARARRLAFTSSFAIPSVWVSFPFGFVCAGDSSSSLASNALLQRCLLAHYFSCSASCSPGHCGATRLPPSPALTLRNCALFPLLRVKSLISRPRRISSCLF